MSSIASNASTAFSPSTARSDDVLYEASGGIARITINRPARFNAYSTESLRDLGQRVDVSRRPRGTVGQRAGFGRQRG